MTATQIIDKKLFSGLQNLIDESLDSRLYWNGIVSKFNRPCGFIISRFSQALKRSSHFFFPVRLKGTTPYPGKPGSSDSEPSALTTGLLEKAVALACPRYSWPRMLEVAPCTVVRSYIQIFSVVSSCTGTQRNETLTNCVTTPCIDMKTIWIPPCTGTPGQPHFFGLMAYYYFV